MRRSLSIAQSIWLARTKSGRDASIESEEPRQGVARHVGFASAVIVLAVLAAAVLVGWNSIRSSPGPEAIVQDVRSQPRVDESEADQVVDFEGILLREEQVARLSATFEILVDTPTEAEDIAQARQYLFVHYGVTVSDAEFRNESL